MSCRWSSGRSRIWTGRWRPLQGDTTQIHWHLRHRTLPYSSTAPCFSSLPSFMRSWFGTIQLILTLVKAPLQKLFFLSVLSPFSLHNQHFFPSLITVGHQRQRMNASDAKWTQVRVGLGHETDHLFILCPLDDVICLILTHFSWSKQAWDLSSVGSSLLGPAPAPQLAPRSSQLSLCWPLILSLPFVWGACIYAQWAPITRLPSWIQNRGYETHFACFTLILE